MKVAILCQPFDLVLPPEQTSVGLWTYEVMRRLAADCAIVARRGRGASSGAAGERGRLDLVPSAPLRLWSQASRLWSSVAPPDRALFGHSLYAREYLWAALRRIRVFDPDVVHIHNFAQFAPPIRRAVPRAAIVLHMHCDWLADLPPDATARRLSDVDSVIGCSSHVVRAAASRNRGATSRFVVVPNGAPSPSAALRDGARRVDGRVVFVGRVSPEKGVHTLLAAWPKVVEIHPAAHLQIVGPPAVTPREFLADLSSDPDVRALARFYPNGAPRQDAYRRALEGLVPAEIAGSVTFVGHEPHDRAVARIASASVLVNPSLSEAFGMSLVEALAVGTPVIATRVGGMPDILEATGGGILVEKENPRVLADALVALLSDPDRAAEIGCRGAARIQDLYGWDRIADATHAVYREALARRRTQLAVETCAGCRA
jgi:glycosyltransferase involved in cell wall biosynthesis